MSKLLICCFLCYQYCLFAQSQLITITISDPTFACTGMDIKLDKLYLVDRITNDTIIPNFMAYTYQAVLQHNHSYNIQGFLAEYNTLSAEIDSTTWKSLIISRELFYTMDNEIYEYGQFTGFFFPKNSSKYTQYKNNELAMIAEMLQEYPKTKLILYGYADRKEKKPSKLAFNRTQTIKNLFVIQYKISPDRIQCISKGVAESMEYRLFNYKVQPLTNSRFLDK